MKIILVITFIAIVCLGLVSMENVYGLPFVSQEYSYDTAKHVVVGRILSIEFLEDPNSQYFDQKYREMAGLALYEVQVEEYMKNPMKQSTIQVLGRYIDQKQTIYYERFPYEINQRVLLYLNNASDNLQYDLVIDPRNSRVISEDFSAKQMLQNLKNKSAPLQQIKFGLSINEIVCKNNLVLIQKYDGMPACVTESTKQKLIEREWSTYNKISDSDFNSIKSNIEKLGYDVCSIWLDDNTVVIDLHQIFEGAKHEKQILSQIPHKTNHEIVYHDGYTDYFINNITAHSCE